MIEQVNKNISDTITTQVPNWRAMLKIMKLQSIEKAHPDFFHASGGYRMEIKSYNDRLPNELRRSIEDFIVSSGGYCSKIESNKGYGLKFVHKDIIASVVIPDNLFGGRRSAMTPYKHGSIFVAYSFPAFLTWYQQLGLSLPEFFKSKQSTNE